MYAYFNRFTIEMTKDQAFSVSHQGQCDDDVKELLKNTKIKRQLKKISDDDLKKELKEYGAWNNEELENRKDNEERIIWIAGCDIREEIQEKERNR